MPRRAGVIPKRAPRSTMRRSQATAISQPPPMQKPCTTATLGFGKVASASSAVRFASRYAAPRAGSASAASWAMSAPAQK